MKVLFVNTNIGYGGASKMMVWVANICASEGHDVTFLTYRIPKENQVLSPLIKHVHFQLESSTGPYHNSFLKTILSLRRFIIKESFDLAVAFLSPSQLRLSFACIGTRTRLLYSHRGDPSQKSSGWKGELINALNRWAFCRADYFVFQTGMAKSCFPKKVQNRSSVIENPVIPLVRTKAREDGIEKRIVSVARLDIHQKRQDLLVNAFRLITDEYPDYTLELYGDGDDEEKLRQLSQGVSQIHFMGKTSDIVSVSQQASMFVLSSDYEGIPNALLEEMSIGVPCISTDCSPGGAAMLIKNGINGLLVPCDDVTALSDAMRFFIDNPTDRERMGAEAYAVNSEFSETIIAKKWVDVFIKSMGRRFLTN